MTELIEKKPQLMRARINQGRLKYLLDRAAGAVGKMHPYYLINVYLTRVEVTATNLDITIIAEMSKGDDDIIDMGGVICVPAKKFQAIIDALPDALIEISSLPGNKVQIECGEYNGMIPAVDPVEHFPQIELPGESAIAIGGDLIPDLFAACRHAIAKDETKPRVCGLHLCSNDDQLLAVSTDGYRLSLASKAVDEQVSLELFETGVTIPIKMCVEIAKIKAGFVEIRISDNSFAIISRGITVIARLLDGQYPSYRRVIPITHQHCCVANTADLTEKIERVSILSENNVVIMDIQPGPAPGEGDILIETENCAGKISDLVPAEVQGEAVRLAFNPNYLLEALHSIGKTSADVVIKYADDKAGIILIPADHAGWDERLEIVMPRGKG